MSNIDERIVQMTFDNAQFEKGISQSIDSLSELDKSLELKNSSSGLEQISKTAKTIDFSEMTEGIAKAIANVPILTRAISTVKDNIASELAQIETAFENFLSGITIDPIKSGYSEYETQINAIQTILSNTRSAGTTIDDVNAALDELNEYADLTIYNFTEMTKNIGTFTAAGVDLETSTAAIKGIANLAAVSGSTSTQAATAMYQLSQALSTGVVKLQDWNSVVNAGMGGQVFQDALTETARLHDIAIDDMIEEEGSFRATLSEGWLTSEILLETLEKFTGDLTEAELLEMGYTEEQAAEIIALGQDANDAATKVKTLSQLIDTVKEALGSGWTQSWEYIIGNFEEAREFWTSVSDAINEIISESANNRNWVLQGWYEAGGRADLIEGLTDIFSALWGVVSAVGDAMQDVFPDITEDNLLSFSTGVKNLGSYLKTVLDYTTSIKQLSRRVTETTTEEAVSEFTEELEKGDTGDEVTELQENLIELGFDVGTTGADGIFGSNTLAALKAFQEEYELTVDGIYNEEVRDKMAELLNVETTTTSWESVTSTVYTFGDVLRKVKNIAQGFFSILKIIVNAFIFVLNVIKAVLQVISPFGNVILTLASAIGEAFTSLKDGIEASSVFDSWLADIIGWLEPISEWASKAAMAVLDFFGLGDSDNETTESIMTFSKLWENMKDSLKRYGVFDALSDAWDAISAAGERLQKTIVNLWEATKGYFSTLKTSDGKSLSEVFGDFDIKTTAINAITMIANVIVDAIDFLAYAVSNIPSVWSKITSFFSKIANLFSSLGSSIPQISVISDNIIEKAKTFFVEGWSTITDIFNKASQYISKAISAVQGVIDSIGGFPALALYGIIIVTMVSLSKSFSIVGDITDLIGDTAGTFLKSQKLKTIAKVLQSITLLLGVIVASIQLLGNMNTGNLIKGGVTTAIILAAIGFFLIVLTSFIKNTNSKNLSKTSASLAAIASFLLSTSLVIAAMIAAIWVLGNMSVQNLAKGLIGLAGIMAAIIVFMKVIGSFSKDGKLNISLVGLSSIAVMIYYLVKIMKLLSKMSWETYFNGLAKLALLMIALSLFIKSVTKVAGGTISVAGFAGLGVCFLAIAAAMKILANMTIGEYITATLGLIVVMGLLGAFIKSISNVIGKDGIGKMGGLISIAISIGVLAGALWIVGHMTWAGIAKGFAGLLAICVALKAFLKGVSGLDIKSGIGVLISAVGLIAVIIVFVAALHMIKDIDTSVILSFGIAIAAIMISIGVMSKLSAGGSGAGLVSAVSLVGIIAAFSYALVELYKLGINANEILAFSTALTEIMLGFSGLLVASKFAGFSGLAVALAAIVGVVTTIGLIVAAFGELSKIDGFNEFMAGGAASLGNIIGSFVGAFSSAMQSSGLKTLANSGLTEETAENVVEIANIIATFGSGLSSDTASNLSNFTDALSDFGYAFDDLRYYSEFVATKEDAEAFKEKIEVLVSIAESIKDFSSDLPEVEEGFGNKLAALIGLTPLGVFSIGLQEFGYGLQSFNSSLKNITTEDANTLKEKTEPLISVANSINEFSQGLPAVGDGFENKIFALLGITPLGVFSTGIKQFGNGIKKFNNSLKNITTEDANTLKEKTEPLISVANAINNFAEKLPAVDNTLDGRINSLFNITALGKFSDDMEDFGTSIKKFNTKLENISTEDANALNTKVKPLISVAKAINDFASGLPEIDDSFQGRLSSLFGITSMGEFSTGMEDLGTGFVSFANSLSVIGTGDVASAEDLTSYADTAISIANSIATFAKGISECPDGGSESFATLASYDLDIFSGSMSNFGEEFKAYATALSGIEGTAWEDISENTSTAIEVGTSIATFFTALNDEGTFNIEVPKTTFWTWLTGTSEDTTVDALGQQMSTFGTNMSTLAGYIDGFSTGSFEADSDVLLNISRDLAQFFTDLNNTDETNGMMYDTSWSTRLSDFIYEVECLGTAFSEIGLTVTNDLGEDGLSLIEVVVTRMASIAESIVEIGNGLENDPVQYFKDTIVELSTILNTPASEEEATGSIVDRATELSASITSLETCLSESAIQSLENSMDRLISVFNSDLQLDSSNLTEEMSTYASNFSSSVSDTAITISASVDQLSGAGSTIAAAISSSIASASVESSSINALVDKIVSALKQRVSDFKTVGSYFVSGLASGLIYSSALKNKVISLANSIESTMRQELGIESPSKVAMSIGDFFVQGLASGLDDDANTVVKSASELASAVIGTTEEGVSSLSSLLADSMEADPVVRPVVDLTNVSNAASGIQGMLGNAYSISAGVSSSMANSAARAFKTNAKLQNDNGTSGIDNSTNTNSAINLTGNTFNVRSEQDIHNLARELATLTVQQQRSYGCL